MPGWRQFRRVATCALAAAFAALAWSAGAARDRTPVAWAGRSFSKGVDLSRLTEVEAKGCQFMTDMGLKSDIFPLLRKRSVGAVRLRLYVAPEGGWCDAKDSLGKAFRARKAGMDVMLAFQYSDVAATSSAQTPPKAWAGLSPDEMLAAASNHTATVLAMFKASSIEPRWVQIGSETSDGFLWPAFRAGASPRRFAAAFAACRAAAKSVFPHVKIVAHVGRADDAAGTDRCLGALAESEVKFDMAGFTLFPQRDAPVGRDSDEFLKECLAKIDGAAHKWNCETMVVEAGFDGTPAAYEESRQRLAFLLFSVRQMRRCRGLFYCDPECRPRSDGWKYGAFDEMGRPTPLLEGFKE